MIVDREAWRPIMVRLMSDPEAVELMDSTWHQEIALRRHASLHGRRYVVLMLVV